MLDATPAQADPGRVTEANPTRPDPEVPERAHRRTFTARYKLDVLAAYDAADLGEKGAILRREGLYSSHVVDWRRARDAGALAALAQPRGRRRPDQRMVTNPVRTAARAAVAAAEAALVAAERALPQLLAGPATTQQKNADRPGAHQRIEAATRTREQARAALRPVPAKVAATELDPDATRARPRIERRGLQMVLRLLAYNGEAWLAEHFNAYLADPDEHRAILRRPWMTLQRRSTRSFGAG